MTQSCVQNSLLTRASGTISIASNDIGRLSIGSVIDVLPQIGIHSPIALIQIRRRNAVLPQRSIDRYSVKSVADLRRSLPSFRDNLCIHRTEQTPVGLLLIMIVITSVHVGMPVTEIHDLVAGTVPRDGVLLSRIERVKEGNAVQGEPNGTQRQSVAVLENRLGKSRFDLRILRQRPRERLLGNRVRIVVVPVSCRVEAHGKIAHAMGGNARARDDEFVAVVSRAFGAGDCARKRRVGRRRSAPRDRRRLRRRARIRLNRRCFRIAARYETEIGARERRRRGDESGESEESEHGAIRGQRIRVEQRVRNVFSTCRRTR